MITEQKLTQHAEYTHKYNITSGRHGWLRLTPAYSVKIVEELLTGYRKPVHILDPFCGTATTVLSAAYNNHQATALDINPFLIWFGSAKTTHYSNLAIKDTLLASTKIKLILKQGAIKPLAPPPIFNIERWWNSANLSFLCSLKTAISLVSKPQSLQHDLLLVAFCRTLIELSNAAFNHQSLSFKNTINQVFVDNTELFEVFQRNLDFVLKGVVENPTGTSKLILGDARQAADFIKDKVDLVITSPPYVNRMSYIRELRPYMYWLNFLADGRQAGELDWQAIGGTWGIATSRLNSWQKPQNSFENPILTKVLIEIAQQDNKNGQLLSNYIAKYFDDMWLHFQSLSQILAPFAKIHYIVGNSTFYGILVPVEQIIIAMLNTLGFKNVECRPIRKRNSKKELIEFDIAATWSNG